MPKTLKSLFLLLLLLLPSGVLAADSISYCSHVQNIGWSATRIY